MTPMTDMTTGRLTGLERDEQTQMWLAQAQQLVDSRPDGPFSARWMQAAAGMGDVATLATLEPTPGK